MTWLILLDTMHLSFVVAKKNNTTIICYVCCYVKSCSALAIILVCYFFLQSFPLLQISLWWRKKEIAFGCILAFLTHSKWEFIIRMCECVCVLVVSCDSRPIRIFRYSTLTYANAVVNVQKILVWSQLQNLCIYKYWTHHS